MTLQQRLIVWIAILASFVSFLDGSIINVALPAITKELGGGLATQQWVVDAYLITLGTLILLAGALSDSFGRLRILRIGLVGFAVTSLLCAAAPNAAVLIAGRAFQGVFGALLVPGSLALIISSFQGKVQGKAIGSWTAWTGISFIIGPLVGGTFIDTLSWRWIFAINIIPIILTLVLMRRLAQQSAAVPTSIDYRGGAMATLGLGAVVYALIEQPHYTLASPLVWGPFLVGLLLLAQFIRHERRVVNPILPPGLFRVRNFLYGNIATFAIYGALSIATFVIVIFVQQSAGYTAFKAGLTTRPVSLIMLALSSRFGELAGKYGPRLFMTAGPAVAALGFLLMLSTGRDFDYWQQLLPGVAVFGLGLSLTVAPLTSAVLADVSERQSGVASAVNNAISRIAGLVAIACIGTVIGSRLDVAGFHRSLIATAALLAVGSLVSWIGIRSPAKDA